jgi:phospholipid/cholesterol/gamma-HCH transport system ATP-binding protein
VIELKDVTFFREDRMVFNRIGFSIREGERIAVLGNSGSGKTTLLRLIMGLERPHSGSIIIDGVDITLLSEKQLFPIRMKFSIVFQEGALFDSLNVNDNIAFPLRENHRMNNTEIDAAVRQILKTIGLEESLHLMPQELSGGMKRRVAIARALVAQHPEMFFYDEPTSDLDPVNAEIICRLMLKLSSSGNGFIMVTHEIIHALAVAERFMVIKDGDLTFDGDREQLFDPRNSTMREFIGRLNWQAVHGVPQSFTLD